jgi:ribosomal protein L33
MLIPKYLEHISKVVKQSKHNVTVKLQCECGESKFIVLKNKPLEADKLAKEQWEKLINERFSRGNVYQYSDKDGNRFIVRKNIFGIIVDKARLNDMPRYFDTNIIKLVCNNCGKEHIIFDNRIHGYDAYVEKRNNVSYEGIEFKQKTFKGSNNNLVAIEIKIDNDITFEEFCDQEGKEVTTEEYTNAFSNIIIYGNIIDLNNKRVTIFSEETA